jgi:hypothetical protein
MLGRIGAGSSLNGKKARQTKPRLEKDRFPPVSNYFFSFSKAAMNAFGPPGM